MEKGAGDQFVSRNRAASRTSRRDSRDPAIRRGDALLRLEIPLGRSRLYQSPKRAHAVSVKLKSSVVAESFPQNWNHWKRAWHHFYAEQTLAADWAHLLTTTSPYNV